MCYTEKAPNARQRRETQVFMCSSMDGRVQWIEGTERPLSWDGLEAMIASPGWRGFGCESSRLNRVDSSGPCSRVKQVGCHMLVLYWMFSARRRPYVTGPGSKSRITQRRQNKPSNTQEPKQRSTRPEQRMTARNSEPCVSHPLAGYGGMRMQEPGGRIPDDRVHAGASLYT